MIRLDGMLLNTYKTFYLTYFMLIYKVNKMSSFNF